MSMTQEEIETALAERAQFIAEMETLAGKEEAAQLAIVVAAEAKIAEAAGLTDEERTALGFAARAERLASLNRNSGQGNGRA